MVEFPPQALDDILRGDSFYRNLLKERKQNLKDGCTNCKVKNLECLKNILLALHDKVYLEEYDEVSIKLIDKMLIIIGGYSPPALLTGYWFTSINNAPITEEEIIASNPFTFTEGTSMKVPFKVEDYAFYGVAYPLSESDRVKYIDVADADNKGDLGSPNDLMGAVILTDNFKQQITNYPSIQITDLILS